MECVAASATPLTVTWPGKTAILEIFRGPCLGASSDGTAERWIDGETPAVARLRRRASEIAHGGALLAVVEGEPGTGKLHVAKWMHLCGKRAERAMAVLDASEPDATQQLAELRVALRGGNAAVPGTLVVRSYHAASSSFTHLLLDLYTVQHGKPNCAIVLLCGRPVAEIRGLSLQHAQMLGRAAGAMLEIPPLRRRKPDIPVLARRLMTDAARRHGRTLRGLSPQALARLEAYDFPGNVRELATLIEQAVLRSQSDWITADSFPGIGDNGHGRTVEAGELLIRLPGSSLRDIELQVLRLALRLAGGRVVRASELLGITRHTLRRKLTKYGLRELQRTAPTARVAETGREHI
jgi:DNA-binding NtrC family response regulator